MAKVPNTPGPHIYITHCTARREEPDGNWTTAGGYSAVIATDGHLARDLALDEFAPDFPTADGWEIEMHAYELNDQYVIDLADQLKAAKAHENG